MGNKYINYPIVSVSCATYNHEKYIRKTLEGFLMQRTQFRFEILINDDASTDGTPNIVREYEHKYPDLIFPLYQKENQYSKGIVISPTYNWPRARGKYIALCEGDDYWTDPLKLQKQVDFLENNPDYGLVHTELDHYYVKSGRYVKNHWLKARVTNQSGDLYNSLLGGGNSMIYTCTVCFRKDLILDVDNARFSRYLYGDVPVWLHIASKSKIGYLNESTAVRNVLLNSLTQGRDFDFKMKLAKNSELIFNDFNKYKPFSEETQYKWKQRYKRKICEICYQYRKDYELFEHNYNSLDNEFKTFIIKLKRILFKWNIPVKLSRIIVYISKKLFPMR